MAVPSNEPLVPYGEGGSVWLTPRGPDMSPLAFGTIVFAGVLGGCLLRPCLRGPYLTARAPGRRAHGGAGARARAPLRPPPPPAGGAAPPPRARPRPDPPSATQPGSPSSLARAPAPPGTRGR